MEIDWRDIGTIVATSSVVGAAAMAFVRYKLAGDFARTSDVAALGVRMQTLEARISGMPQHDDVRALTHRVAELDRHIAVVAAQMAGAVDLLRRVEHQTGLLLEHELNPRHPRP